MSFTAHKFTPKCRIKDLVDYAIIARNIDLQDSLSEIKQTEPILLTILKRAEITVNENGQIIVTTYTKDGIDRPFVFMTPYDRDMNVDDCCLYFHSDDQEETQALMNHYGGEIPISYFYTYEPVIAPYLLVFKHLVPKNELTNYEGYTVTEFILSKLRIINKEIAQ